MLNNTNWGGQSVLIEQLVRLANLFEEPLFLLSGDGTIQIANQAFGSLIGSGPEQICGKPLSEFVSVSIEAIARFFHDSSQREEGFQGTLSVRNSEGSTIRCDWRGGVLQTSLVSGVALLLLQVVPQLNKRQIPGEKKEPFSFLLDLFRIPLGQLQLCKQQVDLGQLVRGAARELEDNLQQASVVLGLHAPETPVWLSADSERMKQAFRTLLDKAIKFATGGGRVAVRIGKDSHEEKATVQIKETGIDPSQVLQPPEPSTQAEQGAPTSSHGFDLSLSLAKSLIELHGGTMRAERISQSRGTAVTILLPLVPEPAALTMRPVPGPVLRPLRVLIIEDHPDSADSLRLLLELRGHEVRVAYTGPGGVKAAIEWTPDVVLADIGLPGLDGYGIARELRRNPATARTRLIAVTGYGSEQDRQRALESGFEVHLTKPADPELIQQLLDRQWSRMS